MSNKMLLISFLFFFQNQINPVCLQFLEANKEDWNIQSPQNKEYLPLSSVKSSTHQNLLFQHCYSANTQMKTKSSLV